MYNNHTAESDISSGLLSMKYGEKIKTDLSESEIADQIEKRKKLAEEVRSVRTGHFAFFAKLVPHLLEKSLDTVRASELLVSP